MIASPASASTTVVTSHAVPSPLRARYLTVLGWSFATFNSIRVLAYLPTLWAIHTSAESSQHSLWTWMTWLGANATMAAWLYENHGQRINKAVVVNASNACMCLAVSVVILVHRIA